MRILGMMSGTSADGIDAALVDFTIDGDHLAAEVVASSETNYPLELRRTVRAAQDPERASSHDLAELHAIIGDAHARVAADLLEKHSADAVCLHGQTVNHRVVDGRVIASLQLGDPARVAVGTGLPVIHSVRGNDIALGGQGAPFAPLLDAMLMGGSDDIAFLNVGGIANITRKCFLKIEAFDTGPGNCLIDAYVEEVSDGQLSYDADGAIAAAGTVDEDLLRKLLADLYFGQTPPKSTGREYFTLEWVKRRLENKGFSASTSTTLEDVVATLTALTAHSIANALGEVKTVYVSGGGVHNRTMMRMLEERGIDVRSIRERGIDPDLKEAILMAVIGFATLHGLSSTVADTGARCPAIAGSIALPPTSHSLGEILRQAPPAFKAAWPSPLRMSHRKDEL